VSLILIITICGCKNDALTNEINSAAIKVSYGMSGMSIVGSVSDRAVMLIAHSEGASMQTTETLNE
jgi:hypothetical protein